MLDKQNQERMDKIMELATEVELSGEVIIGVLVFDVNNLDQQHCPTCRGGYVLTACASTASLIDHKYQQLERDRDATRN